MICNSPSQECHSSMHMTDNEIKSRTTQMHKNTIHILESRQQLKWFELIVAKVDYAYAIRQMLCETDLLMNHQDFSPRRSKSRKSSVFQL